MTLGFTWLGRASYRAVWDLQESLRRRILDGDESAERILLVEHEPVVTLGRSADDGNVKLPFAELERRGVEVVRSSRGGDVTYHGPGQLVIYPVVKLRRGLLAHVEGVGNAIADELRALGIEGAWRRDPAGVWVGGAKIAACGVHVSRRVAIHGFALNVTSEALVGFHHIVPCGLACSRTTSIEAERPGTRPDLAALGAQIAARMCEAWGRTPVCSCDQNLSR